MKKIQPQRITAIIDTKEKQPLPLEQHGLNVIRKSLPFGDYTLLGLEQYLAIERKTIPDLVACCGKERGRFNRELLALRGYPWRMVIIEGSISQIMHREYRSTLEPDTITASITRWLDIGIPFVFADDRYAAALIVAKLLIFKASAIDRFSTAAARRIFLENKEYLEE